MVQKVYMVLAVAHMCMCTLITLHNGLEPQQIAIVTCLMKQLALTKHLFLHKHPYKQKPQIWPQKLVIVSQQQNNNHSHKTMQIIAQRLLMLMF